MRENGEKENPTNARGRDVEKEVSRKNSRRTVVPPYMHAAGRPDQHIDQNEASISRKSKRGEPRGRIFTKLVGQKKRGKS